MITPLQPPRLSPNALTVLRQRYLAKNERGIVVESPADMFHRVARDIASAEPIARRRSLARRFYEVMASLTFLPNSPTLMNAGRPLQQLSACCVLPVGDSLDSIFDAVKHQALIHRRSHDHGGDTTRTASPGVPQASQSERTSSRTVTSRDRPSRIDSTSFADSGRSSSVICDRARYCHGASCPDASDLPAAQRQRGVENDQLASHRDDEGRRCRVLVGTRAEMQRTDRISIRQSRTTSIVLFPRTILLSRHPYQIRRC